jgi:hypothetical protein
MSACAPPRKAPSPERASLPENRDSAAAFQSTGRLEAPEHGGGPAVRFLVRGVRECQFPASGDAKFPERRQLFVRAGGGVCLVCHLASLTNFAWRLYTIFGHILQVFQKKCSF